MIYQLWENKYERGYGGLSVLGPLGG